MNPHTNYVAVGLFLLFGIGPTILAKQFFLQFTHPDIGSINRIREQGETGDEPVRPERLPARRYQYCHF